VTTGLVGAAPEPVEQPFTFRRRNAGAGVFDRENDTLTHSSHLDADTAGFACVLASIVHEHGRETVDPLYGCRNCRGGGSNPFQLQIERPGAGKSPKALGTSFGDCCDVDRA